MAVREGGECALAVERRPAAVRLSSGVGGIAERLDLSEKPDVL